MALRKTRLHQRVLAFERCEERSLATLVFVLNGDGYGAASPSVLTANAAEVLDRQQVEPVQLSYPDVTSPAVLSALKRQIADLSHGQPIGIVGFSAGGTLAERLAADPRLHVASVLAYYSPPDLRDYLAYHQSDQDAEYVLGHINSSHAVIRALSGPNKTDAHVVTAFGLYDDNVVAAQSTESFLKDYPDGRVYTYPGAHGVSITASLPALTDFLGHV